ncbi:UNVERIFIED_CONTAM: hypothetical protein NCL1_14771 [Trichonephila clavipes]
MHFHLKHAIYWPQNTRPEGFYAFAKFGNKLDRYRAALLDLFSTTARTRGNLFVKKVEDELRERVSETDCRQIFEVSTLKYFPRLKFFFNFSFKILHLRCSVLEILC